MNRHDTPAAVGGSCLLTIFAVICLVVFALLSVSTVQADGRLSKAQAEAVSAYYEADCRAEEILAELRAGTVPTGVSYDAGIYRYECAVSPTQTLKVAVAINGESYEILQWQTVSSADWNEQEGPKVWDADSIVG